MVYNKAYMEGIMDESCIFNRTNVSLLIEGESIGQNIENEILIANKIH